MDKQLVIEIFLEDCKEMTRQGQQGAIYQQYGYIQKPNCKFPEQIKFNLPDGITFYPAGQYLINPLSYQKDNYGGLKLGFSLHLQPLAQANASASNDAAAASKKAS